MRIALDNAGSYLEPDEKPTRGGLRFYKRIARAQRIAGTLSGHQLTLECGHRVQAFGELGRLDGAVLCTRCRDLEAK